jgi:phosphoglycerate dehydrogenase-like enzyme
MEVVCRMTRKTIAVLPAIARPLLEPKLPAWLEARWFASQQDALDMGPGAEIGWMDMLDRKAMSDAITNASDLKWLNSIYAGVDGMPLQLLQERGTVVTNGAGINAITIAEYVVMGMLTIAKGYREVVRAQDRHEWLMDSTGKIELFGSKALLLGYGAIGQLIEERLRPFAVDVTIVRRSGGRSALTPDQWRDRLGEFDWVIIAVPATAETERMIGMPEFSKMKPGASIVNIARGTVIDQQALVEALKTNAIRAAFLDVTDPEPLPADHPLWSLENAHITMHLSGRAQDKMFIRATERFLENLRRYELGDPLEPRVNLALGY